VASCDFGASVLFATDTFASSADNLLSPIPPQMSCDVDGWMTRRKRTPGHDWCLIALAAPAVIHGLDIETSHFSSDYAPFVSVEAANIPTLEQELATVLRDGRNLNGQVSELVRTSMSTIATQPSKSSSPSSPSASSSNLCNLYKKLESEREVLIGEVDTFLEQHSSTDSRQWLDLLPMTELRCQPSAICHNYFAVCRGVKNKIRSQEDSSEVTHIRINLFPDGAIARVRAFGEVVWRPMESRDWTSICRPLPSFKCHPSKDNIDALPNLMSATLGAVALVCSDQSGSTPSNLLIPQTEAPTKAYRGWLTARKVLRAPVVFEDEGGNALNLLGDEWVIVKLATRAVVTRGTEFVVDTSTYAAECPTECEMQCCDLPDVSVLPIVEQMEFFKTTPNVKWKTLLRRSGLNCHEVQSFLDLEFVGSLTHVRFLIVPDGGVSRVKLLASPFKL